MYERTDRENALERTNERVMATSELSLASIEPGCPCTHGTSYCSNHSHRFNSPILTYQEKTCNSKLGMAEGEGGYIVTWGEMAMAKPGFRASVPNA